MRFLTGGLNIMKINYYPETDSMYIDLSSKTAVESKEISEGVVVDYDDKGGIVGIDIDNASSKIDLDELIMQHVPVKSQIISA